MKSIILRAIASMIVGGLLMAFPEKVSDWLVIVTGVLFLAPGVYSLVSYYTLKKDNSVPVSLPIAGVGSTILGVWMILNPTFFIKALMAAVAVALIIVAVNRIVGNIRARKFVQVPFWFYLFPVLLIVVAGYVLAHPLQAAGLPIYILGISMIVYGLLELWNTIWLHYRIEKYMSEHKTIENVDVVDAVIVE